MTTPLAYSVAIPAGIEQDAFVQQAYRTKRSFVAVHFNPAGKGEISFLPEGALLRITGPSSCLREGFEILFEEQVYSIFRVDLLTRCSLASEPIPTRGRAVGACA
jgi:hypothetical protein